MSRLGSAGLQATLAIVLSLGLWLFVSFSENPDERATFEGLSLSLRGVDERLVLVDQNSLPNPALSSVNVTVVTDRRQRNQIRSVDLRAFVDLSELGPGDYSVPVSVEVTRSDLSVTVPSDGIEPRTIPIRLEELITSTVPITLVIQGNLPFSFELGQPEIRQASRVIEAVSVAGPQSRVQRVVAARATVNIDQIRASYSAPLQLQPIDDKGQLVEGVSLDPTLVNVTIPIQPVVGLRLVPVQPVIRGLPAPGYRIIAIEVRPQLVTLTGNSGALDLVDVIVTEPIDINGARGELTREARLSFPSGTSAGPREVEQVTVTVKIEPLTQLFQVSLPAQVSLLGLSGGLLSSLQPQVVTVELSGPSSTLDRISKQPLLAEIDVSSLGPGLYTLTPRFPLPPGVSVVGPAPQVTVILRAPPTPEPTERVPTLTPTTTAQPTEPTSTDGPALSPGPASPTNEPQPSANPAPGESPTSGETAPSPSQSAQPSPAQQPSAQPTAQPSTTPSPSPQPSATP